MGERPGPPVLVLLDSPEPHIRALRGTKVRHPVLHEGQCQRTGRFARDIRLVRIPDTVVMILEWLTPREVKVPQEADMVVAPARLPPGTPMFPADTPRPERVPIPLSLIVPLSLVHLLMVAPFLSPANARHMMHVDTEATVITQWVIPFMQ